MAAHLRSDADRQRGDADRQPVRPVIVERHRRLDLAEPDIAVELFGRVDAVEAYAVAEDDEQVPFHRCPQLIGIGAQGRRPVAGRVDVGSEEQIGRRQPVDGLRHQRIVAARSLDQRVTGNAPVVGRPVDDGEPYEVIQRVAREGRRQGVRGRRLGLSPGRHERQLLRKQVAMRARAADDRVNHRVGPDRRQHGQEVMAAVEIRHAGPRAWLLGRR